MYFHDFFLVLYSSEDMAAGFIVFLFHPTLDVCNSDLMWMSFSNTHFR